MGLPLIAANSGTYYVYLHYHPKRKKVVYIGKGTKERDYSDKRTVQEHANLLKAGSLKVHRILDDVSESVAFEQESYLIDLFGRIKDDGSLFNLQSGVKKGVSHLPKYKGVKKGESHLPKYKGVTQSKFSAIAEDAKLTNWLDEYTESKKRQGVSDYTLSRINTHLVRVSEALNWTVVSDFDEAKLAAYLNSRDLSERTHKNYLESWRAFLSFLESMRGGKK